MKFWRRLLICFAPHRPELPRKDRELIEASRSVRRDLREGAVVVTKNQRALAELRRLESHARR